MKTERTQSQLGLVKGAVQSGRQPKGDDKIHWNIRKDGADKLSLRAHKQSLG